MGVKLDKKPSSAVFSKKIIQNINRLVHSFEPQQAEVLLELFDNVDKLELELDISEAQNIYFTKVYQKIGDILSSSSSRKSDKKLVEMLLDIGTKLNINTEFYRNKLVAV